MRLLMALLMMVLIAGPVAGPALASPILTSDPAPETVVDSCKIQGEGFTLPCSISADRAIWIDLATLPRGRVYTITAQFCVQGGLWCSDHSAPFSFPAPMVGSPSTMRLSIQ